MKFFTIFSSSQILIEDKYHNGGIMVNEEGKIIYILNQNEIPKAKSQTNIEIINVGDLVIMPGVIDTHVHVNEPGRTNWEGFKTATKAAAAGGITTIVDMPLNSKPPTTTVENFEKKIKAAKGKIYVDVAFWGGLLPGNQDQLLPLVERGVIGFKGFMCQSGIEEFPYVTTNDIESAYKTLQDTNIVLAFHAEAESNNTETKGIASHYETFLKSRPSALEVKAVSEVIAISQKYNVHTHIVHVSAAECLPIIAEAKKNGANLTAETTHHYLYFNAEEIPNGATQYKCTPPIRELPNQGLLWDGLKDGTLDMVISDHSPCTSDLKELDTGNFLKAWGGISSVQFGLSTFWSGARNHGLSIFDINKYLTVAPAKLAGLNEYKGVIAVDYDADFVIWNPNETFVVEESMIQHKNKLTPYLNRTLYGKVYMTVVRGHIVYEEGKDFPPPLGKLLIK